MSSVLVSVMWANYSPDQLDLLSKPGGCCIAYHLSLNCSSENQFLHKMRVNMCLTTHSLGTCCFNTIKWQQSFVQLYYLSFYLIPLKQHFYQIQWRKPSVQSVHSLKAEILQPVLCSSCCICVACENQLEGKWERQSSSCSQRSLWDFVFYSDFVLVFLLISTKSDFILLRFYGENVLYKLNESSGYLLEG